MGEVAVIRSWDGEGNEWRFDLLEDGQAAGFATAIRLDEGAVWLAELYIRPEVAGRPARRRGLGGHLLGVVLAALGGYTLLLSADPFEFPGQPGGHPDAAALAAWYGRHGFTRGEGLTMHRPAGGDPGQDDDRAAAAEARRLVRATLGPGGRQLASRTRREDT